MNAAPNSQRCRSDDAAVHVGAAAGAPAGGAFRLARASPSTGSSSWISLTAPLRLRHGPRLLWRTLVLASWLVSSWHPASGSPPRATTPLMGILRTSSGARCITRSNDTIGLCMTGAGARAAHAIAWQMWLDHAASMVPCNQRPHISGRSLQTRTKSSNSWPNAWGNNCTGCLARLKHRCGLPSCDCAAPASGRSCEWSRAKALAFARCRLRRRHGSRQRRWQRRRE